MSLDAAALYALLPAVYRTRDAAGGGQLQALFAVMAAQSAVVEDNINQLYDDQFIETCAPWVIPYIADLIGYNSVYEIAVAGSGSRAEVANTIGYRQRKGTLLALEQVTADISGHATLAAERFRRLITTESMRLVERGHDATVSMRDGRALDLLGTAFDVTNRTIDVRRIAPRARVVADPNTAPLDIALHGPGVSNIPDVAVHLWRWQSWAVTDALAAVADGGRYRFSQLGHDMPIFSSPPARTAFTSLTTRADIPLPIGRRELAHYYGPKASVLLTADGAPVDVSKVYGANLADRPGGSWCTVAYGKIAIDPELGRIQYGPGITPPQLLEVSYNYGFPAPMGGGSYDRSASLTQLDPADPNVFLAIVGSAEYPTLESAITGPNQQPVWNQQSAGSTGIIVLPCFASLTANLTAAVQLPAGSSLTIVAAEPVPAEGPRAVAWSNSRVTITGDIAVNGVAAPSGAPVPPPAGKLMISGIWLAGQLTVEGAGSVIQVADSTLVPGLGLLPDGEPLSPGDPSIVVTATGASLTLNRVISGPIAAGPAGPRESATASSTRRRRTTSRSAARTWPAPEPTCISRTARSSARCAPGPSPWRPAASSTLAWAAATPGPRPSGPAASKPAASASVCCRSVPSRRTATGACPPPPRRSPRWSPPSSRSATGSPGMRCSAATCPWPSGPARTTARSWAPTSRSRKPRRSAMSSCEFPSTCPRFWRAGSSFTRPGTLNPRSCPPLTAITCGPTTGRRTAPESAPG